MPQSPQTSVQLVLAGAVVHADPRGALIWPDQKLVAIADLHFEKASGHSRRDGRFLPPYDTRATLDKLDRVISDWGAERVVCLGDTFHDGGAAERMDAGDRRRLAEHIAQLEWIWIAGNHDPDPPADLGGRHVDALEAGPLRFVHTPTPGPVAGEVAGHLHPAHTVWAQGRRFRRKCFLTDGARMILPAFGATTGSLDSNDPAYAGLFGPDLRAIMLQRNKAISVPVSAEIQNAR